MKINGSLLSQPPRGEISWQIPDTAREPCILAKPIVNDVWKDAGKVVNAAGTAFSQWTALLVKSVARLLRGKKRRAPNVRCKSRADIMAREG